MKDNKEVKICVASPLGETIHFEERREMTRREMMSIIDDDPQKDDGNVR